MASVQISLRKPHPVATQPCADGDELERFVSQIDDKARAQARGRPKAMRNFVIARLRPFEQAAIHRAAAVNNCRHEDVVGEVEHVHYAALSHSDTLPMTS